MRSDHGGWTKGALGISMGALTLLLSANLFELSGAGWFWFLVLAVPLGPAALLGHWAGCTLAWRTRGRVLATAALWIALPSSAVFSATESAVAQVVASLAIAASAGILLVATITSALNAAGWLINRRRAQAGLAPLSEAASNRLRQLKPLEQASILLGGVALLFMAVGLLVDTEPAVQTTGLMGVLASALTRAWEMMRGVAVSILAGAIVLFVQARGGLLDESTPRPPDVEVGARDQTQTTPDEEETELPHVERNAQLPRSVGVAVLAVALGVATGLISRARER